MPGDTTYTPVQRPEDSNNHFAALSAIVATALSRVSGSTLVQVKSVKGEGLNPVGFVDVQIMVHQQDGNGVTYPHGVIHNIPYIRLQGGSRAFICDPQPGDIGVMLVCERDISGVKKNRSASGPGSFRQNDYADGIYIGGPLNAAPTEYCGWIDGDFHVKTTGAFIVDAESMEVNCGIKATGDVVAGSISLDSHTHGGVKAGTDTTGGPE
ncbi:baseplate assembly protein [Acetobacter sp.]|uniref:baseplate assembly protein n=1 Tax=Acetobacter sp. TaxID=440 RepID=UPI0039E8962A